MDKPDIFKFDDSLYYSRTGLDATVHVIEEQQDVPLVIVITQSEEVKADIHALIEYAIGQDELLWSKLEEISSKQYELIASVASPKLRKGLETSVRGYFVEMEEILKGVWLVCHCSDITKEHILGIGSIWTAEP